LKKQYLTREDAIFALKRMQDFHDACKSLYQRHGFNLLDNLGRRNIVLSQAQEKYFADALSQKFKDVRNDGRTGEPDIVIGELGMELECKLTSRHKGGAISFSTDYQTLLQKKGLDYLYVIADTNFKAFAVLHFQGLTVEDFRPLAAGSRGKVAMAKHQGMQKCKVLYGNVVNLNEKNLTKLHIKLLVSKLPPHKRQKLQKSIAYWQNTPIKYSFELEALDEN
jgi:hypothetical protein